MKSIVFPFYSRFANYFAILEIHAVSLQFCSSVGLFLFLSRYFLLLWFFLGFALNTHLNSAEFADFNLIPVCPSVARAPLNATPTTHPCTFFWTVRISGSFQVSGNRIVATSGKRHQETSVIV